MYKGKNNYCSNCNDAIIKKFVDNDRKVDHHHKQMQYDGNIEVVNYKQFSNRGTRLQYTHVGLL